MGSEISTASKPEVLTEFRKSYAQNEQSIPESPENRKRTDPKWLFVFLATIVLLGPFAIYTLVNSDIRLIGSDVDDCGNLCGYVNDKRLNLSCSGQSMVDKPYTRYVPIEGYEDLYHTTCVEQCEKNEVQFLKTCLEASETVSNRARRDVVMEKQPDMNAIMGSLWKLVFTTAITIGLSFGVILLLRYATAVLVWSILIFSLIIFVGMTIILWVASGDDTNQEQAQKAFSGAIAMTIITACLIFLVIFMYKKIHLVILLFKEATKAIFDMPLLIIVPILTFVVEAIVFGLFAITTVLMYTSGKLEEVYPNVWHIEPNGVMIFAMIFNVIVGYLVLQFIIGIQYMTISGAVSSWYFCRNKPTLQGPIKNSFFVTIKFHLGSIALGSFVLTIVWLIKIILRSLARNEKLRFFVTCCMNYIEYFVKFLSKNAYIVQSIHGRPFFKSGKRAANLLLTNAKSVIAINSIGDYVLGMAQVIIIVISTGISYTIFSSLEQAVVPTILALMINIIVVIIMFAIFETTIDTLFICFCEDKENNDGISKPYFMSTGLMQFIDQTNKIYQPNN